MFPLIENLFFLLISREVVSAWQPQFHFGYSNIHVAFSSETEH